MTQLSRGAAIVRGLNALREFHGHVAFCDTCKPVMQDAVGDKVTLSLDEVKRGFCRKGRRAFKNAFTRTGRKLWAMLEPTNRRNQSAQSVTSGKDGEPAQVAAPALPKAD